MIDFRKMADHWLYQKESQAMLTQFVLVLPMDFANPRKLGIFRSSLVEHIYMGN